MDVPKASAVKSIAVQAYRLTQEHTILTSIGRVWHLGRAKAHDFEVCPQTLIHHFKPHPLEPHVAARQSRAQGCYNRQDSTRVSANAAQWIKAGTPQRAPHVPGGVMRGPTSIDPHAFFTRLPRLIP